jgi:hypothetical protein
VYAEEDSDYEECRPLVDFPVPILNRVAGPFLICEGCFPRRFLQCGPGSSGTFRTTSPLPYDLKFILAAIP